MSNEFKVIETQEQLETIIKDRLARKERTVREEYANYEVYKEAYESHENVKKDYEEKIAEMQKQYEDTQNTINSLNSKIAKYESDSVKTKACIEYGLPLEMASRLHGANEEDIMKDASLLSNFVSVNAAPPLRNPEARSEDGVSSAFRKLNPNIKI